MFEYCPCVGCGQPIVIRLSFWLTVIPNPQLVSRFVQVIFFRTSLSNACQGVQVSHPKGATYQRRFLWGITHSSGEKLKVTDDLDAQMGSDKNWFGYGFSDRNNKGERFVKFYNFRLSTSATHRWSTGSHTTPIESSISPSAVDLRVVIWICAFKGVTDIRLREDYHLIVSNLRLRVPVASDHMRAKRQFHIQYTVYAIQLSPSSGKLGCCTSDANNPPVNIDKCKTAIKSIFICGAGQLVVPKERYKIRLIVKALRRIDEREELRSLLMTITRLILTHWGSVTLKS